MALYRRPCRSAAMATKPTESPRRYELCICPAGRRLYWRNPNHGVTLGNDSMTWTMDGTAVEMAYGNIVAVHLNSQGQKITADRCTITFSDNSGLLIVNTDPGGFADAARAQAYRDFVRDLHARLAAGAYTQIRFTAGVPRWRYRTMLAGAVAAALFFGITGPIGYFVFHLWNGLALFLLGFYFCWTIGRRALANAPRDYTPDKLPEALLT
jgi:hypothetical protein